MVALQSKDRRSGSVIVMTMVLTLLSVGTALAVLSFATHSIELTKRSLDYQRARTAAEAGLDYGREQLLDTLRTYQFTLNQSDLQTGFDALAPPPAFSNFVYQTPGGYSAFRITADTATATGTVTYGTAAVGSEGIYQFFTITCGARMTGSGVGAVLKERIQAVSVHMNRFGVFYEKDLEIDPGPTMTFDGPVHANGDLYVDGPIDFYDRLTAHGNATHGRKDNGSVVGNVFIENDAGTLVSMMVGSTIIDSSHPEWMTDALTRWHGRVLDSAHGVSYLAAPYNPLDNPHDIIEAALPTNDPNYRIETEAAKFANKAALRIHVGNTGVFTATDYFGSNVTASFTQAIVDEDDDHSYGGVPLDKKSGGAYEFDTPGTYDISKTFYDGREAATMAVVDLYVDRLTAEFPQLTSGDAYGESEGRGVVYVIRDDPDGPGGLIPAVRVRNGRELPVGGLTIASDLPVYVEGDYNTLNIIKPAMVAGDAVTLLSSAWQDARSTGPLTDRLPVNTTYNGVIMTGNYPTIPGGAYNAIPLR